MILSACFGGEEGRGAGVEGLSSSSSSWMTAFFRPRTLVSMPSLEGRDIRMCFSSSPQPPLSSNLPPSFLSLHRRTQPTRANGKMCGVPPFGAGRAHADPGVRGHQARGSAQHRGRVRPQHLPLRAAVHRAALQTGAKQSEVAKHTLVRWSVVRFQDRRRGVSRPSPLFSSALLANHRVSSRQRAQKVMTRHQDRGACN